MIRVPGQGLLGNVTHGIELGDAMDQNTAVKRTNDGFADTTEGFDSELIVASNDSSSEFADDNVGKLREKIKAARLEKLMARQLESELSIDEISFEPSMDNETLAETEAAVERSQASVATQRTRLDLYEREPSSVGRSRFQSSRSDCESLLSDFRQQSEVLGRIADRSSSFLDYLNRMEEEFKTMDSMEIELREKTRELERSENKNAENQTLIDKQRKQIELLETMRTTATENYEQARRDLDSSQVENDQIRTKLNESVALTARLERENMAITEKFDTVRSEHEKAAASVNSLRRQNQDQDRQLTQATAELHEISTSNEQALNELSNIQIKYNELNKKSLESQGQHYAKISELEETVRELKSLLDRRTRERSELKNELEAANNLLVLHEEMIAALSPQRRS